MKPIMNKPLLRPLWTIATPAVLPPCRRLGSTTTSNPHVRHAGRNSTRSIVDITAAYVAKSFAMNAPNKGKI